MEKLFNGYPESIICFGHHHPVHFFKNESKVFVNPGSLGCCHQPIARYAIIHVNNQAIDFELKSIPYDRNSFLQSYEELLVPNRQFILQAFHGIDFRYKT